MGKSMMSWKSSTDVLAAIHQTREDLRAGTIQTDQAHAEARLLGGAVRLLDTSLEHARLTGRLVQGSPSLPRFTLDDEVTR